MSRFLHNLKTFSKRYYKKEGLIFTCILDMEVKMLYGMIMFYILALVLGVFGFSGTTTSSGFVIAQGLFFVFLIAFIVTMSIVYSRSVDNKF